MSKVILVILLFVSAQISWGQSDKINLIDIAQDLQWRKFGSGYDRNYFLGNDVVNIFGKDLVGYSYALISDREHPQLQKLKNEVLVAILNTPTGSKICQTVGRGDQSAIQFKFGINDEYYSRVKSTCSIGLAGFFQRDPFPFALKTSVGLKGYYFIFTDAPQMRFSSWTTKERVTFIVINPKIDSWNSIVAAFAHELTMMLDNMANPTHSPIVERAFVEKYKIEPQKACDIFMTTASATMRWALNIQRASIVENTMLKEAGIAIDDSSEGGSCEDKLIENLDIASRLDVFYSHLYTNRILPECSIKAAGTNLLDFAFLLSREKVPGSNQSFCELLSTVDFDPKHKNSYEEYDLPPGPRPRISGGTGLSVLSDYGASREQLNQLRRQRLSEIYSDGSIELKKGERNEKSDYLSPSPNSSEALKSRNLNIRGDYSLIPR